MGFEFLHDTGDGEPIRIPEIGLELRVRLPKAASGGELTVIETVNTPGFGPPVHRHKETEVFRVTQGRYLFEVDGKRFHAAAGDVVCVPGGAAHGFVNVTDAPARQIVMILPGFDAGSFFTGLADVLLGGRPDPAALAAFGKRWGVEFLGPPIQPDQ
jgi:quercetin dioxygenase-like cupin family protein